MRCTSRNLEKDSSGSITLVAEDQEDLWGVFNLISKKDLVRASTIRKVVSETTTGSTDKSSVRTTLTLRVESVEYDVQGGMLRVTGRNVSENKYVKMGAYHTTELELHRPFTISKPYWDIISLEVIAESCDVTNRADIAALLIQDGLANICLVTENMSLVRQRVEVNIPRKRPGREGNVEKALDKFFERCADALIRNVNWEKVKVCIVAGPGFTKDKFMSYLMRASQTAISTTSQTASLYRTLLDNKSKLLPLHASSAHKASLKEILENPAIQGRLADTKYAKEVKALEKFYKTLSEDPCKAFYGRKWVEKCVERGAVDTLLVTNELFRSASIPLRRHYISLVETVRNSGGTVLIFSELHVSGEQLKQLTGVACICQWSCPEIEHEIEEEEKKEGGNKKADSYADLVEVDDDMEKPAWAPNEEIEL